MEGRIFGLSKRTANTFALLNMEPGFNTEVFDRAIEELRRANLPTEDLCEVREKISRNIEADFGVWPYFIPNKPSLCGPLTILNCSYVDEELSLPLGFSIEASATRPTAFAKPYYIDPINSSRRCPGLFAVESYSDRRNWKYDLSFIGFRGHRPEKDGDFRDSKFCRAILLGRFESELVNRNRHRRIRFQVNEQFFYRDQTASRESRILANDESGYIHSLEESKFVLCPRGVGKNSIRFFEVLAKCNVPIYVGDKETKFPLDWLIDWNVACFRIPFEDILDGTYISHIENILASTVDAINVRRRYIFRIYHQFLAPERKAVFEQLVLLEAKRFLETMETGRTRY